jgi:hypothetical protein
MGRSVRRFVEWCWGCCCSVAPSEIDSALATIRSDNDDDVELPVADQVHDLYTRLLPPDSPKPDPDLVPVPLDSPSRPKLSFSNMLMHDSVITDRLRLKKSGWAEETPIQDD